MQGAYITNQNGVVVVSLTAQLTLTYCCFPYLQQQVPQQGTVGII